MRSIILPCVLLVSISACTPYRLPSSTVMAPSASEIQVGSIIIENKMPPQQLSMEYFPDYNYADERLQSSFRQRIADVPKSSFTASGSGPEIRFIFTKAYMGWKTTTEDSLSIIPIIGILPSLSAGANDRPLNSHVFLTIEIVNDRDQVLKFKDIEVVTEKLGSLDKITDSLGALSDATEVHLRQEIETTLRRYFPEVSNSPPI